MLHTQYIVLHVNQFVEKLKKKQKPGAKRVCIKRNKSLDHKIVEITVSSDFRMRSLSVRGRPVGRKEYAEFGKCTHKKVTP